MGASRRVKTALPDRYPRSVVDAFLCFALDLLCFLGSLALTGSGRWQTPISTSASLPPDPIHSTR